MSSGADSETEIERLEPLIGEWEMEAVFPSSSPAAGMEVDGVARTVFEWMPGGRFVVQSWEVPNPAAPDGIAVIGWDGERGSFLQHYFDSRGVARVYAMSFDDGIWELSRTAADFTLLDFSQRYRGSLSADGEEIRGSWEIKHDGSEWEHDFELNYLRIG